MICLQANAALNAEAEQPGLESGSADSTYSFALQPTGSSRLIQVALVAVAVGMVDLLFHVGKNVFGGVTHRGNPWYQPAKLGRDQAQFIDAIAAGPATIRYAPRSAQKGSDPALLDLR